ncbi:MAG: hypothetical protein IT307_01760, partial [Chloroflexi bacterium]|nr:hypothetical protein [Chloroflexota bacterium]
MSASLTDRVVELTQRLIQIPSPSGEEAAVAAFIARMLADAGLEAEVYEADANRPNVVARLRG